MVDDLLDIPDQTEKLPSRHRRRELSQDLTPDSSFVSSRSYSKVQKNGGEPTTISTSISTKRSPQMGISSLRLRSPEMLKMFHRSEGKTGDESVAKENSHKLESQNCPKHSEKTFADDSQSDYGSLSPSKISDKNTGGKERHSPTILATSASSSPLSESRLSNFFKSRKAFAPFQSLSPNLKVKNSGCVGGKGGQPDSLLSPNDAIALASFARHTRTHSDCLAVKTPFVSASTPNSPTLIRRYISSTSYENEQDKMSNKL